MEVIIHARALSLFGNTCICRLQADSVEQRLAGRQLSVKSLNSSSWFICIKKLLIKYDLPQATELLDNPPSKYRWKTLEKKQIDEYWLDQMRHKAKLYSSLRFLHSEAYLPDRTHPLIQEVVGVTNVARIQTKLRLVTGTYVLQTNRSAFNQNQISPVCLLCRAEDETTEHFLLRCAGLEIVRQPAFTEILEIYVQHFGNQFTQIYLFSLFWTWVGGQCVEWYGC